MGTAVLVVAFFASVSAFGGHVAVQHATGTGLVSATTLGSFVCTAPLVGAGLLAYLSAVVDTHCAVPDWTIRPACEQDVEPLLSLWSAAGSAETVTDTREGVLSLLDADPEALLVAESDGDEIVGSLIAAWDGWRGSFYRLAVHPDRRREGLATALLHEGERHLRACGAAKLTAIVTDEDPDAMGFWAATGYEQQQSRARFVRNVAPRAPVRNSGPVR